MQTISLAGLWDPRLDAEYDGLVEDLSHDAVDGTVYLPGTTDKYGYGEDVAEGGRNHLHSTHRYEGPAWYRPRFRSPTSGNTSP